MPRIDPQALVRSGGFTGAAAAELAAQLDAFERAPMNAGRLIDAGVPTVTATVLVEQMHAMLLVERKGWFDPGKQLQTVWPGDGYALIAAAGNAIDPERVHWGYAGHGAPDRAG